MLTASPMSVSCAVCGHSFDPAAHVRWTKDGFVIVCCPSCGLLFRRDLPSTEELDAIYGPAYFSGDAQLHGQGYLDYTGDADAHRAISRRRLAALENLADRGRLLDVGTAAGFFVDEARARGWEAAGIDVSEAMVSWGRRELDVPLERATLASAAVPEGSLDVLTMWDYIEHSLEPRRDLERAHTLLREGGVLALSTGDASSLVARVSGRHWHLLTPRHHNFFFSAATLRELIERTNFEIVRLDHRGSRYPVRYLLHKLKLTSRVIADSRVGALTLPVNLWDIATVFARRR
jgi:2-polyprenyl-3-methyl-5-hydroxy-6-metoxy-1,4-benzoquinol methylase